MVYAETMYGLDLTTYNLQILLLSTNEELDIFITFKGIPTPSHAYVTALLHS